jgi:hypothetical protein
LCDLSFNSFISDKSSQASKHISKDKRGAEFTAMRTMSSNSIVASKSVQRAQLPGMKVQPVKNLKSASGPEASGMQSDEDDSLERDVAMLSPMKGKDYRNSVQVCFASCPLGIYYSYFSRW